MLIRRKESKMDIENILDLAKNRKMVLAVTGACAICGGIGYAVWANREIIGKKIKDLAGAINKKEHVETEESPAAKPKSVNLEHEKEVKKEPTSKKTKKEVKKEPTSKKTKAEDKPKGKSMNKEPEIISFDEFFDEENQNDKSTINYYTEDDVVSDERDEVLDHDVVGDDNLDRFGYMSNDPDVLYVRNYKLGIDYEICKIKDSYLRSMYGVTPDDQGNKKDNKTKKKANNDE